jgi:putative zinc finger/helix-turn-helix YgiT family protein
MPRKKNDACPLCGVGKLEEMTGDFTTKVDGPEGRAITITVPGLTWLHCPSCKEDLLDERATATISAYHRAGLKLLTADDIRAIRQKLGKTQAQMSALLGIGEKTYCRWESGSHFQSEAFDRYLRALQASPSLVGVLNDIRRQKQSDCSPPTARFRYIESVAAYESTSERFTQLLEIGCFQLQST